MRNRHRLGFFAAAITVATIVTAPVEAGVITVGDFLRNVANALRLPAQDGMTAEAALRAAGFALPPDDRSADLTEGTVAAISTAMGLRITSNNPAASFDKERLRTFMSVVSSDLNSLPSGGVSAQSSSSESSGDKKKPHSKSPKKPKKPKKAKKPKKSKNSDH